MRICVHICVYACIYPYMRANNDWRVKLATHPPSRGCNYGLYHKAKLFMFCFLFQ